VRLPGLPPWPAGRTRLARLFAEARSPLAWRAVGYHLLAGLTGTAGFLALIAFWTAGTTLTTIALYEWALPQVNIFGWHLHDPLVLIAIGAVGLLAFFTAPWVARGLAGADTWLATSVLGPSRIDRLDDRVRTLTVSRAGLVDATDLERRRLERDLHDGIQQRLTSLAVHLGVAREELGDVPEAVRQVIVEAHEQTKQTLSELRDIVRGLHPAVLESRGLDAALSGVVARAAVEVDLRVDVPVRPAPAIEAVAYFAVCEALTNVTKHAGARRVEIDVRRAGDVLHLLFADDGKGGASVDGGTGLRGMSQRVASVDGRIDILSPPGEGTRITVELPCQI
jgi:signal transduction histidine kinase